MGVARLTRKTLVVLGNQAFRCHNILRLRFPVLRLRLRQEDPRAPQVPQEPGRPRDKAGQCLDANNGRLHGPYISGGSPRVQQAVRRLR